MTQLTEWTKKHKGLVQQSMQGGCMVALIDPKLQKFGPETFPNVQEWPNDHKMTFLSDILERDAPASYRLSAAACLGILRRADKRGKALPALLDAALKQVAYPDRFGLGGNGGPSLEGYAPDLSPTVTNGPPFSRTGNARVEADALVVGLDGIGGNGGPTIEPITFDWQAGGGGADTSFKGKSRMYITDMPGRTRALVANKTLGVIDCERLKRRMVCECAMAFESSDEIGGLSPAECPRCGETVNISYDDEGEAWCVHAQAITRDGQVSAAVAARGGSSAGAGMTDDGSSYSLMAGAPHAVAVPEGDGPKGFYESGPGWWGDGEAGIALRASGGSNGGGSEGLVAQPLAYGISAQPTPKIAADMTPTPTPTLTQPSPSGGGHPMAVAFATSGYGAQEGEVASTMQASCDRLSNQVYGVVVPFDTTQITIPCNRSNPGLDDLCHLLAAQAHVPSVALSGRGGWDEAATLRAQDSVNKADTGVASRRPALEAALGFFEDAGMDRTWCRDAAQSLTAAYGKQPDNSDTSEPAVVAQGFAQNASGEVRASDQSGALNTNSNASGRNAPLVAHASHWDGPNPHPTLNQSARGTGGIGASNQEVFSQRGASRVPDTRWIVRRLTPTECSRLQGFPDDWCRIPGMADGPIYKALGNSWACNNISWFARRIVDRFGKEAA